MKINEIRAVLKDAATHWFDGNTFQLGAALAYYSVFAVAPTLVIAVGIAGMVFGPDAARGQLHDRLGELIGPTIAPAIEESLAQAQESGQGWLAALMGIVGLVLGSIGVFVQLQSTLNSIFEVTPRRGRGIRGMLRDRLLSFVMVLGIGAALLLALGANAVLSALGGLLHPVQMPGGLILWHVLHWVLSLGLLTLLFALMYQVLPDVRLQWADVWLGAAVTAVLFTLGNFLIGLYLGRSGVASVYGAAGSLIVLLLWVYYSSQVLLFGAEFVNAHAVRNGHRPEPTANAERLICAPASQ